MSAKIAASKAVPCLSRSLSYWHVADCSHNDHAAIYRYNISKPIVHLEKTQKAQSTHEITRSVPLPSFLRWITVLHFKQGTVLMS